MPARVTIVVRPEYLLCILSTLLFFSCDKLSQKNDDCKFVKGANRGNFGAIGQGFAAIDANLLRRKIDDPEGGVPN